MKLAALPLAITLLLLAGCDRGSEEAGDGDPTWTATIADGISKREPMTSVVCPPKLRKLLSRAHEIVLAGEGPFTCARAVAEKLAPKGSPPAVDTVPTAAEGPITASVAAWYDEKGWGSLVSPETPGGIFVHSSVIEAKGYRSLQVGQMVEVEYTDAVPGGQDGHAWVAENVRP